MRLKSEFFFFCPLVSLLIAASGGYAADAKPAGADTGSSRLLANGIYLILQETLDESEIKNIQADERLLEYKNEFMAESSSQPIQYFLIKKSPDVPLLLAEAPGKGKDAEGKTMLNLRLADENVSKLQQFTRDNIGKRLVMVIDGKPVTAHKIRAEIKDGKVQITRCSDNACEYLYLRLNEKYAAENP
jgi:preprotein translocase subunit SecD